MKFYYDTKIDDYQNVWEAIHKLAERFQCSDESDEWAGVCESMEDLHIAIFGIGQVELQNSIAKRKDWRQNTSHIRVSSGDGYWLDDNGERMTTVWTSEGWLNLPDSYGVAGHVPLDECERRQANGGDDANLDVLIHYGGRVIEVQHVDFEDENPLFRGCFWADSSRNNTGYTQYD